MVVLNRRGPVYVCSLIGKAYMELALVCFASCQLIQLVSYGSLLPTVDDDPKTKTVSICSINRSLHVWLSGFVLAHLEFELGDPGSIPVSCHYFVG